MASKPMVSAATTSADVAFALSDIARGQQSKGELRLAQIMESSREVFLEDGYAAFSARRVAARVGITLGNLQYYFRAKEELQRATVEVGLREVLERYLHLIDTPGANAASRFSALADRIFLDAYETRLASFLIEAWAFGHRQPYAAQLVGEAYSQYLDGLAGLLKQIDSRLTSDECRVRALALITLGGGMMLFERESEASEKDDVAFARIAKRYIRTIAGKARPQARAVEGRVQSNDRDAPEPDAPGGGAAGRSHADVFGSDIYVLEGRLQWTVLRNGTDARYSRPTMRAKRREAKINDIVTTAANVFASEGYAHFTQTRIARELGLLPSALQHYFPTREDLFNFTVATLMNTYNERYAQMARPSDTPPLQRLSALVEDVFEENCNPSVGRFWLEMLSVAGRSQVTLAFLKQAYSAYRAVYVDLVREIDPTATARECVARATLILAQLEGVLIFTGRGGLRLPDLGGVRAFMKTAALDIAQGCRRSKAASHP
ncbi:MAG TPA: TetR/AcrR family transcriptional regulator [Trinickia sp.]